MFNGAGFPFGTMKKFGKWLHATGNVINATEFYT